MDKIAIARTVLNLYSNLEYICEKIDNEVNSTTQIMAKTSYAYIGTMLNVYESVSEVIYRKSLLVNLKIYLEQALGLLSSDRAGILYLKYMDKFSTRQIAMFTDSNIRNVERNLILATREFASNLCKVGLTEEKFLEVLKNEKWINHIYQYFSKNNYQPTTSVCEIKISNGIITHGTINKLTKREFRCMKI